MGRGEIKDLIHQRTKEPNCMKQEKSTNRRRKGVERGGAEGVKEMQLLDRSHKSAAFVDYRKEDNTETPAD